MTVPDVLPSATFCHVVYIRCWNGAACSQLPLTFQLALTSPDSLKQLSFPTPGLSRQSPLGRCQISIRSLSLQEQVVSHAAENSLTAKRQTTSDAQTDDLISHLQSPPTPPHPASHCPPGEERSSQCRWCGGRASTRILTFQQLACKPKSEWSRWRVTTDAEL